MRFLLLAGFLLAPFVSTSPTPVIALSPRDPSASDPPWGPNDFSIRVAGQGPNPLAQRACYVSAVSMLAAQAAQDFHGRLSSPRVTFSHAQYPDLAIIVASAHAFDCVPRRYVLWGMARLMNYLVLGNDFRDSFFVLRWQGSMVGNIYMGPPPQRPTLSKTADTALTAMESSVISQANDTSATPVGVDALSFHFQFYGRSLTMSDIFMGAIGTLIEAAQPASDEKLQSFTGSFQPYLVVYDWSSTPAGPSSFTYSMLITSIVASVMCALEQLDFHELRVLVKIGTREIGKGEYFTA